MAPRYLGPLTLVADLPGRRALRFAGTNRLHIPPVRLSTVGTRAFSVAEHSIWNNLPEDITSAETLYTLYNCAVRRCTVPIHGMQSIMNLLCCTTFSTEKLNDCTKLKL